MLLFFQSNTAADLKNIRKCALKKLSGAQTPTASFRFHGLLRSLYSTFCNLISSDCNAEYLGEDTNCEMRESFLKVVLMSGYKWNPSRAMRVDTLG